MIDTITDLEKETGLVARNAKRAAKFEKAEDLLLDARDHPDEYVAVNIADRVEFLEANGYKVTKQNLLNAQLSAKLPPQQDEDEQPA